MSSRRFSDELAAPRRRGYAIDDEEGTAGVRCLAAPVLSREKNAPLSVSLMGTTTQISESNTPTLAVEFMRAAANIAGLLSTDSDE